MNLLCLDSEGTIRVRNKVIPNIDEILMDLEKNGTLTVLATGLPKHLIDNFYRNIYEFPFLILSNGAQIFETKSKQTIYYESIDSNFFSFLIEVKKKYNFQLKVTIYGKEFTTSESCVNENTKFISFEELLELKDVCQIYVMEDCSLTLQAKEKFILGFDKASLTTKQRKKFDKLLEDNNIVDLYRLLSFVQMNALRKELLNYGYVKVSNDSLDAYSFKHSKEPFWFSLNAKNVSKYNAMEFLVKFLNINGTKIISIGNDKNDFDLLSKSYFSIKIKSSKCRFNIKNGVIIRQNQLEFILYFLLAYLQNGICIEEFEKDLKNLKGKVPLIVRLSDGNSETSEIRFASRGIIKNHKEEIVLFNKARIGEIKLPGGGMEKYETPLAAFIRESKEETGYLLKNISLIGFTIERKTKTKFKQISFIYEADIMKNTNQMDLTSEEAYNMGEKHIISIWDAYEFLKHAKAQLMNLSKEDMYQEKFVVRRDYKILKYFIDTMRKKYE